MNPYDYAPRWSALEGDERANALSNLCDALERQDEVRRAKWQRFLSLYEGRSVSLEDDQYFTDSINSIGIPPQYNLIRSACDTAQADIAGRQKPKPLFMTTGSDWRTRRAAKRADKFVEATLCQRQGQYEDAWRLMLDVQIDSTKGDGGLAKVWGDVNRKKIRIERVLPWEVHVDAREARYGDPRNLFHCYDMERDLAEHTFCNVENDEEGNQRRRDAIRSAKPSKPSSQRIVQSIKIREGWCLPYDEEHPGCHVIAVDNCELFAEEWTRPRFPFVKLLWNHHTLGWWGTGIAEEGETQQGVVNDTSERLAERIRICSTRITYYNGNVVKRENLEQGGDAEILIAVDDMSQVPVTPPATPAAPQEFQWLNDSIQRFYEMRGVSQMTANAQKPPGVDAAVAMQTLNDIATVRFLPKARAYEVAFEELGQLIIDAARDVAKEHSGFLVNWPGKKLLEQINFNELNLDDEEMYQIRVAPVSQFSRDPSAILELAQEFRDRGDISRETYLQMVGLPDFERLLNRETAESEWIMDLMDRYLDCMSDQELDEAGGFESPEPFLANIPGAVAICVATYWEAKRDKAPEYCLENIRKFIVELQSVASGAANGPAAQGPQQVQAPVAGAMAPFPNAAMPTGPEMAPGIASAPMPAAA